MATQMIGVTTTRNSRADRMAMPLARDVLRDLAIENGACTRPVQLRRRNVETGEVDQVLVPCGHTLASVCESCAERAKTLRAAQCREGWHLEDEPDLIPGSASEDQKWWLTLRAEAQFFRDQAEQAGTDTTDLDELITELDAEINGAGIRGKAAPARPSRRHRSTRRRQDATTPRPTPSVHMQRGWPRRCGSSRARRPARTGSATVSSRRTPGRA